MNVPDDVREALLNAARAAVNESVDPFYPPDIVVDSVDAVLAHLEQVGSFYETKRGGMMRILTPDDGFGLEDYEPVYRIRKP